MIKKIICTDCGCPYEATLKECPECACPNDEWQPEAEAAAPPAAEQPKETTAPTNEQPEAMPEEFVVCGECGASVAKSAKACSECGCPVDENTVQCLECSCYYDASLVKCPQCGCPNECLDEAKKVEIARHNEAELQELEIERQRIAQLQTESHETKDQPDPAMSIIRSLKRVFVRCDNFSGRARRSEFWTFVSFNCLVGFILYMVLFACIGRDYIVVSDAPNETEYWRRLIVCCLSNHLIVSIVIMVYLLLVSLPLLSVTIRRLHDTNRSGIWIFIAIVPFVFGLVYGFSPYIGIICLSAMLLLDSVGDNMWGKRHS